MQFEIITIFPAFFEGIFQHGIVRRAQAEGLVRLGVHDLRTFTHDRHRTVDDRPFGGGEGMVLKPEPIFDCVEGMGIPPRAERKRESVVMLTPQGKLFRQDLAQELAGLDRVVFICGRYEGVDERVSEELADRELSVGDYILSGGELAAAIVLDAVTRLLPGALGNEASARQESFTRYTDKTVPPPADAPAGSVPPDSTCGSGGLLDYPHYTRPAEFRGMQVPDVLVGGNHDDIRRWRRRKALEKTLRNRPDLLTRVELSAEERDWVAQIVAGGQKI
jgi:tRNA (guanine37-N1)-methyltransferase